jgi:hypothetical protein
MKTRRHKWFLALLVGMSAVVIISWFLRDQEQNLGPEFLSQKTAQLETTWDQLLDKQPVDAVASSPVHKDQSTVPGDVSAPSGPTIFSISPQVRRYRILAKKALRTDAENQEIEALLSSHEAMAEARNALLQEDNAYFTEGNLISRIRVIDYLTKAASWADNPGQQQLRQTLVDFIKTPVTSPGISTEGRQARATDRIEVYYILKKYHPDLAQELQQNAEAYGLQKLIAYAEQNEKKMNFAATQP